MNSGENIFFQKAELCKDYICEDFCITAIPRYCPFLNTQNGILQRQKDFWEQHKGPRSANWLRNRKRRFCEDPKKDKSYN